MAGKGNGRLDCTHASNPYHVCSEHCFEKKGESKKQIVRKDSGNGAPKYSGERKNTDHSGCTRGSNPYHDCNEFCSNLTTQSGRPKTERDSAVGSGGARKHSPPKSPQKLNVPLTSAVSSKPQVTKTRVPPEEKTSLVEDSLTIEEQNKFSKLILVSANALKAEAESLQKLCKTDTSSDRPEISELVHPSVRVEEEGDHKAFSPNITNFPFPTMAPNHKGNDDEEVKSISSDPSVPVGKYYVKASLAPILQSIFNKHGDIAASCKLESISIRSYYLESVCYVIHELQSTEFSLKVSKSKVRELLAILNDVVSSGMNVGWLHSILNDIAQTVESSGQKWTLEAAKANCDHEMELIKKELEFQMQDLTQKETEMNDAKAKVADTRSRLSELEFKYFQLNKEISSLQFKVNDFKFNDLVDKLL